MTRHAMTYTGGRSGSPSLATLAANVGPLVYYVRTRDDLVKIGHTTALASRVSFYGGFSRLLAVQAGTRDDERALHQRFAPHRARGAEYYEPSAAVFDHIDDVRAALRLSPVERWARA